jgi:hypothetical protein
MIRTVCVPQQAVVNVPIPNHYIGRKIEVILYRMDEVEGSQQPQKRDVAQFKGLLTAEEAGHYHEFLKSTRTQWDRNI